MKEQIDGWEYEDALPDLDDSEFSAMFAVSEVRDGVRMYPYRNVPSGRQYLKGSAHEQGATVEGEATSASTTAVAASRVPEGRDAEDHRRDAQQDADSEAAVHRRAESVDHGVALADPRVVKLQAIRASLECDQALGLMRCSLLLGDAQWLVAELTAALQRETEGT